jgi:hypothetical protein
LAENRGEDEIGTFAPRGIEWFTEENSIMKCVPPPFARRVVFWLVASVLAFVRITPVSAQDATVRLDLTTEQYAAALKEAVGNGSAPSQLAVYTEGAAPRFAVVLEPDIDTPWIEKHLLAPQEFQDQFEAYLGQGFRPVSVAVAQEGDAPRFSAIWWKRGEPTWHLHLDVTAERLPELATEYADRDLRPVSVLGYDTAGETRFATLWEAGRTETEFDLSLTVDEYRQRAATRAKASYHPSSIHAYPVAGGTRIAAVWNKRPKGDKSVAEVRAWASHNELSDFVKTGTRGGRITSFSSTMVEGTPVFSVIVERAAK